ncbi:unnamed protein product [Polarella glacialis]|uniref:SAP domain-containing protein n=1 Tax=Polarella glacialis TaxID=89957 RepID=A0A813FTT4_POLGL|nr:unnamed protein product [Polarella glacialis]
MAEDAPVFAGHYVFFKVPELRQEARQRGLDPVGTRRELTLRLLAADARNSVGIDASREEVEEQGPEESKEAEEDDEEEEEEDQGELQELQDCQSDDGVEMDCYGGVKGEIVEASSTSDTLEVGSASEPFLKNVSELSLDCICISDGEEADDTAALDKTAFKGDEAQKEDSDETAMRLQELLQEEVWCSSLELDYVALITRKHSERSTGAGLQGAVPAGRSSSQRCDEDLPRRTQKARWRARQQQLGREAKRRRLEQEGGDQEEEEEDEEQMQHQQQAKRPRLEQEGGDQEEEEEDEEPQQQQAKRPRLEQEGGNQDDVTEDGQEGLDTRPKTTAVVARRLILGHLGVQSSASLDTSGAGLAADDVSGPSDEGGLGWADLASLRQQFVGSG